MSPNDQFLRRASIEGLRQLLLSLDDEIKPPFEKTVQDILWIVYHLLEEEPPV